MIVVFGSINLDLVARVERFPEPGETIAGTTFATYPGGKGANQALAARRAGADVAMAGAVGTDAFADAALANLAEAGVDLGCVRRIDGATGIASIVVDAGGRNAIVVVAGANAHVDVRCIPEPMLGAGTTLLLQLEVPNAAVTEIATRAHRRGARVVLNGAPAAPLAAELFASLDVLVVNEHEAAFFAKHLDVPTRPDAFAASLHRRFGCATVVTLGARGALAAAQQEIFTGRAPAVAVVDSTGAGDAFTGALAAALDRRETWSRALAAGIAAGSLACTVAGAQDGLPRFADIAFVATGVQSGLVSRPIE